jgi:hypothetical protein
VGNGADRWIGGRLATVETSSGQFAVRYDRVTACSPTFRLRRAVVDRSNWIAERAVNVDGVHVETEAC